MAKNDFQLVFCTCPSREVAETLAHGLVTGGHSACVNIVPGLRSVYRWKGAVESADELLLVIKCPAEHFSRVEAFIKANHPYELPEVIAVPLVAGSKAYLSWLAHPDN